MTAYEREALKLATQAKIRALWKARHGFDAHALRDRMHYFIRVLRTLEPYHVLGHHSSRSHKVSSRAG